MYEDNLGTQEENGDWKIGPNTPVFVYLLHANIVPGNQPKKELSS